MRFSQSRYRDNGLYQAFDLGVTRHVGVNSHGKFIEFTVARPTGTGKNPIAELQAGGTTVRRRAGSGGS
jgi:putative transposase